MHMHTHTSIILRYLSYVNYALPTSYNEAHTPYAQTSGLTSNWGMYLDLSLWGMATAKYVGAMQMGTNSNYKNHDFSRGIDVDVAK